MWVAKRWVEFGTDGFLWFTICYKTYLVLRFIKSVDKRKWGRGKKSLRMSLD